MAKILYGVAGQGSGHSSRSREIIEHLMEKGHEIKIISYESGYKNLKDDFDIKKVNGFNLVYEHNEVNYAKTFFDNFLRAPKTLKSINDTLRMVNSFKPDIVFSDYEPISSIVANLKDLPLVSIDNQHLMTNTDISYPKKYERAALTAKAITRAMIMKADAYLIADFVEAKPKNNKTFLFPPILRKSIIKSISEEGDYVLVYITSDFKEILDILKEINKKFIIYGLDRNEKISENIILKKPSQGGFIKDLAGCEGVIGNAGLTLITEALYLGKPYLAVPVKSQFEQILNAYNLEKMGYGKYWDELDREKIESFLFNLEFYKENLKKYKREDNSKIFNKIDELIKEFVV